MDYQQVAHIPILIKEALDCEKEGLILTKQEWGEVDKPLLITTLNEIGGDYMSMITYIDSPSVYGSHHRRGTLSDIGTMVDIALANSSKSHVPNQSNGFLHIQKVPNSDDFIMKANNPNQLHGAGHWIGLSLNKDNAMVLQASKLKDDLRSIEWIMNYNSVEFRVSKMDHVSHKDHILNMKELFKAENWIAACAKKVPRSFPTSIILVIIMLMCGYIMLKL